MQNTPLPVGESHHAQNEFNIKEQVFNYLRYWKLFLIVVIASLSLVHLYLRYYIPQYGVASSILIKDEKRRNK